MWRVKVTTKACSKVTEALKVLMEYEWTKIKMQLQRYFFLMHRETNGSIETGAVTPVCLL